MKREIKFRAWDKDCKDWVYSKFNQSHSYWEIDTINRLTLQGSVWYQFTGLLDRHGKEIYEGDILTYKNPICKGVVKFGVYQFGTYDTYQQGNGFYLDSTQSSACGYFSSKDIEVIGNLFETPELCKD